MSDIELDKDDSVVSIRLNRPAKHNAMTVQMWRDLRAGLLEIAHDDDARVVVLSGEGRSFCAGADMFIEPDVGPEEMLSIVNSAILALHDLPQPTIAKVRGAAIGAGANLALACDFVAASTASFFAQSFVDRGLSVDCGGTWTLPQSVGRRRATEMILLGDRVQADLAARLGMINWALSDDELDAQVEGVAARLADKPPVALRANKALLSRAVPRDFVEALDAEGEWQVKHLTAGLDRDARTTWSARH